MQNKTLTITLSALAFLMLSTGVAYAASGQGFRNFDLTSDQIEVLEQARELRQSGDFEAAQELIKSSGFEIPRLGLGPKNFSRGMMNSREDVREAIENNDYDAFVELSENYPMHIEISEDDFNKLVEAHSLRVEGDYEGARKIMEDLGFPRGPQNEMGRGRMGRF